MNKKMENCKRIITSGDMETEHNAPMQATQIRERGDDVLSWEISPRDYPYILHFHFWFRPHPITYAYVHNEMSIISGRIKHYWPPSKSIKLLLTAEKEALPANAWLSPNQHSTSRMIMGNPSTF